MALGRFKFLWSVSLPLLEFGEWVLRRLTSRILESVRERRKTDRCQKSKKRLQIKDGREEAVNNEGWMKNANKSKSWTSNFLKWSYIVKQIFKTNSVFVYFSCVFLLKTSLTFNCCWPMANTKAKQTIVISFCEMMSDNSFTCFRGKKWKEIKKKENKSSRVEILKMCQGKNGWRDKRKIRF